jgi:hypothetical protein
MHNIFFVLGGKITMSKRWWFYRRILPWIFFCLGMFHEPQIWNLMAIKNIYVDFIQSFHLTIGSRSILTQNELWVPKYYHAIFILFFCLCLGQPKDVINISIYYVPQYLLYITFFCEKWFTFSAFSPFSPS